MMTDPAIDQSHPAADPHATALLERVPAAYRQVLDALAEAWRSDGAELFLVGGIVRDLLMERDLPADLDLATSATPDLTKRLAERVGPRSVYDVGERFGTIGMVFGPPEAPINVEITTYRADAYEPGSRHPAVSYGSSIEDDLARRDATINAIAIDVREPRIVDPSGGWPDIELATLRAVGDPDARFREDPLRILRFARFVAQLGFAVDPATVAAMTRQAGTLATISAERVWIEMTKLLCGEYADAGLDVLLETGALCVAMPELLPLEGAAFGHPGIHREKDLWEHTKRVIVQAPPRPVVRWAALLHDIAKPLTRSVDASGQTHFFGHERIGAGIARRLLRRLNADKATERIVSRLVDMHLRPASYDPATWTNSAVRRLALEADGVLDDLIDLAAADVTSAKAQKQHAAATRVQGLKDHLARLEAEVALAQLQSPLDGNALMAMFDRPPGRWIAEVKDYLRELVIDGDLAPDDVDRAADLARGFIARTDQES